MFFFHIFEKNVFSAADVLFPVYISGLGNTPYGKRHTSRTEPAYGKLNILG